LTHSSPSRPGSRTLLSLAAAACLAGALPAQARVTRIVIDDT
jgi:hypothetical protein